ncbi:YdaU family protein [Verminephrobacter aporrectodeae]|uniref:YdaU family protein n=1 Tax=Verminephrobacter aporrectodeae TaxID=1110389 RepID=UPI0022380793|nr:YdaU family protein [Verminephrobacter aporrectodeae]
MQITDAGWNVWNLHDGDIPAIFNNEFLSAAFLRIESLRQVPAASVPDDDIVLAELAGFGRAVSEWKKVREVALRGWIKCSDGRFYHPGIADKAREAWEAHRQGRAARGVDA